MLHAQKGKQYNTPESDMTDDCELLSASADIDPHCDTPSLLSLSNPKELCPKRSSNVNL
jgi:hypothetical protein